MNKIYKIIWSKTQQRYVVVSELARRCTKQTGRSVCKSAAALLAVLALTASVGAMPAWAADTTYAHEETVGNNNASSWNDTESTFDANSSDNTSKGDGNSFIYANTNTVDGDLNTLKGEEGKTTDKNTVQGDSNILTSSSNNIVNGGVTNHIGSGENARDDGGNELTDSDENIITGDNNTLSSSSGNTIMGGIAKVVGHDSGDKLGKKAEGGNTLTNSDKNNVQGDQNKLTNADNNTIVGGTLVVKSEYGGGVEGGNELRNADNNAVTGDKNKVYEADNNIIIGDSNEVGQWANNPTNDPDKELGIELDNNTIEGSDNKIYHGGNNAIKGNENAIGRSDYDPSSENDITGNTNTLYAASQNNITGNRNQLTQASGNDVYGDNNILNRGSTDGSTADSNHVWGDGNELDNFNSSWVLGSENKIGSTSDKSENNLIFGSRNIAEYMTESMVLGNNNVIGSDTSHHALIDSLLIGSDMTFGKITDLKNSVAIGKNISASLGSDFILIGNNIEASNTVDDTNPYSANQAVVVATDTKQVSDRATMVGYGTAADEGSVAVGLNASAMGDNSIAIGPEAKTQDWNAVAIGYNSSVGKEADYGIALGRNSTISDNSMSAVTIGSYAFVGENAASAIVIGGNGEWGGSSETAYDGDRSAVKDGASQSIAMGAAVTVDTGAKNSIAIGGPEVIGHRENRSEVTVGTNSVNATIIGIGSTIGAESPFNTVYGSESSIGGNTERSIAVGAEVVIGDDVDYATAIGNKATVQAANSVAIGSNSEVATSDILSEQDVKDFLNKENSLYEAFNIEHGDTNGVVSVGKDGMARRVLNVDRGRISATSTDAINGSQLYDLANDFNTKINNAGGTWNLTTNANPNDDVQTTIGKNNTVDFSGTIKDIQLGDDADTGEAILTEHQNIQISQETQYEEDGKTVKGTNVTFDLNDRIILGDSVESYNQVILDGFTGSIYVGGLSGVSIAKDPEYGNGYIINGLANKEWTYANYTNGVYENSGKAATEAQLHDAFGYLDNKINNMEIESDDGNITIKHPEGETTTGGNTGTGNTGEIGTGTGETGTTGGNETGSTGGSGTSSETPANDNTHFVGLTEDVVLGEQNEDGTFNSGSLTVQKDGKGNAITINKEDENGVGNGLVSGLNNTDWDWNKYEQGGYATDNAATEAQLHGAMQGTVQYDRDEDGNPDYTNITLNKGGDSVSIHNVAPGEISSTSTDAVNGSQLHEAWTQINDNTTAITNIGNKVGELDNRIDEVGAGAAALAALHPLDFDPDDKWDFAAGYGNYRGENAVAIGAFYRPNEDTMFSVGGTVGNDDNMINAGVSFKIGQGNGVSTSRVAMAKEIKDLRKEIETLKSAMVEMNAGRKLDTSKLQLFPDVPQNHWAYEYVATLAGNGMLEGYPSGNFDGSRTMTRYEFAAVLYRAMLNGAKLSDKILAEFAPELERFTVDVVHQDKDGNPTVERVRVVKRDDTAK